MIDKVGELNQENKIPKADYIRKKLTADAYSVFDAIDKNKDGKLNNTELSEFGFTTDDFNNTDKNNFAQKYIDYREKVSTLKGATKGFEKYLFGNDPDKLVFPANFTDDERKELIKRMELYSAVQKVLSDDINFPIVKNEYEKIYEKILNGKEINNFHLGYILYQTSLNRNIQDGKIGPYKQGKLGDCWFLSQLNTYASTPQGAKNISDRIRDNQNGSFIVTFQNPLDIEVQEEYTVKMSDICLQYQSQSQGDLDVQILEHAINKMLNKYVEDYAKKPNEETIEQGATYKLMLVHKAFGYKDDPIVYDTTSGHKTLEDIRYHWKSYNGKLDCRHLQTFAKYDTFQDIIEKNQYKPENLNCSRHEQANNDDRNEQEILPCKHQYNILSKENGFMFIQNPHYNYNPINMSDEKFNNFCSTLYYLPTDNLVEYHAEKQPQEPEDENLFRRILNHTGNLIYGHLKLGIMWLYKTAVNTF